MTYTNMEKEKTGKRKKLFNWDLDSTVGGVQMFSLAKGTHLFCILRDSEVNSKNSLYELDLIGY